MKAKSIKEFETEFAKKISKQIVKDDPEVKEYQDYTLKMIEQYLNLCLKHANRIKNGKMLEKDFKKLTKEMDELDKEILGKYSLFGVAPFNPAQEEIKQIRQEWVQVVITHYLRLLKSEIKAETTFENLAKQGYKRKELENVFENRIKIEEQLFETLINTSHPILFFKRKYLKEKLKSFMVISRKMHKEKVDEIFKSI